MRWLILLIMIMLIILFCILNNDPIFVLPIRKFYFTSKEVSSLQVKKHWFKGKLLIVATYYAT